MGKLAIYAKTKDKLDKDIADEARRLKQEDMTGKLTINAALRKAKEIYLRKESKRK